MEAHDVDEDRCEEEQRQRSARKYAYGAVILMLVLLGCLLVFWPGVVRMVSGWFS